MSQYYISDGNTRRGPFPVEQLLSQGLKPDSLVWCEGMADWLPAHSVAEIRPYLSAPQSPQYPAQPQYPQQQQQYGAGFGGQPLQYQSPAGLPTDGPGLGITSMVLGILALVLFWFIYLAVPLGILAVIFGAIGAKRQAGKGMAIAGLVCGAIGMVISILLIIIAVAFISSL